MSLSPPPEGEYGCDEVSLAPDCDPASPILDPGIRLFVTLICAATIVGLHQLAGLAVMFGVACLLAVTARLSMRTTFKRLAALEGFMLAVLAFLPFTTPGATLFTLWGLPASQEGTRHAVDILLKSNAVMLTILALLGSVPVILLGQGLRRLGFPEKLAQLLVFTVRYITVLDREYNRLRQAMKARGFRMRFSLHCWQSIGYLFGMLLVRSLERSERISAAMRCRGFNGTLHGLAETAPLTRRDRLAAGLSILFCLLVLIGDRG